MENSKKGEKAKPAAGNFLIVVGRQYGSGGRRIGKVLAERLGVGYYDKTLLSEAAERLGYAPEIFSKRDEKRPSLLRSLLSLNYGAVGSGMTVAPMSEEELYSIQSRVVKEICAKESCVIVGRTADYVMRDHPRMASLFIHAPEAARAHSVMRRGEADTEKEAVDLARRRDRERCSYYNYYTNSNGWGVASNYHLSFDSSRMDDEAVLVAVCAILGISPGEPVDNPGKN